MGLIHPTDALRPQVPVSYGPVFQHFSLSAFQVLSAWLARRLRLVSDTVALQQMGRSFELWAGQKDSVLRPRAFWPKLQAEIAGLRRAEKPGSLGTDKGTLMPLMPPTEKQSRLIWFALTALAMAALVALLVATVWGLEKILTLLSPVLWPLAIAAVVACLLSPAVDFFERQHLSRAQVRFAGVRDRFLGGGWGAGQRDSTGGG